MKYKLTIALGTIEAENLDEAKEKAQEKLNYFAESNDGSEVLANANPILTEVAQ